MVGIVNYNTGNLHSIENAFAKINTKASVVSKPEDILKCDKLLLPGVGTFGDAMEHLREYDLDEAIKEFAKSGKYILGICLGFQVLFERGYEFGEHKGLGLLKGEVLPFDKTKMEHLKIPHMGWNTIKTKPNKLFENLDKKIYCYFVHSFHVKCEDAETIGYTEYGYDFASAVNKENIFGLQPHPEKSHDNGLKILENFSKI